MQRSTAVQPSNLTRGGREGGPSSVAGTFKPDGGEGRGSSSVAGTHKHCGRAQCAPFIRCSTAGSWLAYLSVGSPPPLTPNTQTMAGPRLACLSVALGRHEWLQSDSAAYSATPYRSPPAGEESSGRSATPLTAMRQSQRNTDRGDTPALMMVWPGVGVPELWLGRQ